MSCSFLLSNCFEDLHICCRLRCYIKGKTQSNNLTYELIRYSTKQSLHYKAWTRRYLFGILLKGLLLNKLITAQNQDDPSRRNHCRYIYLANVQPNETNWPFYPLKTLARALIINVACTNKCFKQLNFEQQALRWEFKSVWNPKSVKDKLDNNKYENFSTTIRRKEPS